MPESEAVSSSSQLEDSPSSSSVTYGELEESVEGRRSWQGKGESATIADGTIGDVKRISEGETGDDEVGEK